MNSYNWYHFVDLDQDSFDEFVVDPFGDEQTSRCDAVLALVEEHAAHTLQKNGHESSFIY